LTSFFAIAHYSPLLVFVTGLSTLVGLWGVGTVILVCIGVRPPSPWSHVAAVLLGIQTLSLVVQIVGMAEEASRSVLSAIWWILVAFGIVTLLLRMRPSFASVFPTFDPLALLPVTIVGAAISANLLVALAPSTKADELYYHMLLPSRIISDGALRFYREPWLGAIWPHMVYQISSTPVHVIGYPDAANVVSWGLSIILLWFAWSVIYASTKSAVWTALWVASLCVGIYPVVWDVTGGAHAMGDLAMAAAIVTFCSRERTLSALSPPTYAALLSLFTLSAATSKVSLLPLSGLLLCVAAWPMLRSAPARLGGQITIALAAPWVIFYCPIVLETWAQSGSPFGPVLSEFFASSAYPDNRAQELFQNARALNRLPLLTVLRYVAADYSPLVWLGVIGAIFGTDLAKTTRAKLACLFVLQCTLICWLSLYAGRYLGGLHYGLLIVFACFATRDIQDWLASARFVTMACTMLLLPWLGIQLYFAKQFFSVSLGLEKTAFYERYVALYADYSKLNQILSKDTVVLVQRGYRLDATYAPRPVFFDVADLPRQKPVVLLTPAGIARSDIPSFDGYTLGDLVYENTNAVIETYRTPGRLPVIGQLQVIQLIRK
jgi:hypothetical protein